MNSVWISFCLQKQYWLCTVRVRTDPITFVISKFKVWNIFIKFLWMIVCCFIKSKIFVLNKFQVFCWFSALWQATFDRMQFFINWVWFSLFFLACAEMRDIYIEFIRREKNRFLHLFNGLAIQFLYFDFAEADDSKLYVEFNVTLSTLYFIMNKIFCNFHIWYSYVIKNLKGYYFYYQ